MTKDRLAALVAVSFRKTVCIFFETEPIRRTVYRNSLVHVPSLSLSLCLSFRWFFHYYSFDSCVLSFCPLPPPWRISIFPCPRSFNSVISILSASFVFYNFLRNDALVRCTYLHICVTAYIYASKYIRTCIVYIYVCHSLLSFHSTGLNVSSETTSDIKRISFAGKMERRRFRGVCLTVDHLVVEQREERTSEWLRKKQKQMRIERERVTDK